MSAGAAWVTQPLAIEAVRSDAALERLRGPWQALVAQDPAVGFFSTWEWAHPWWRHLSGRRRLRVWAARAGSDVVGILPICLRPVAWTRPPPLPRLELLGGGVAGADYLDVIAAPAWEDEVATAFAEALAQESAPLDLARVRPDSRAATLLARALFADDWQMTHCVNSDTVSPRAHLDGDWPTYLAGRGRRHRESWRRKLRTLQAGHAVEWRRAASETQRCAMLADLIRLHELRWHGRGASEAFRTPALRAFQHAVSRAALARGWLRLSLLRVDGRPAAAVYGFSYRGVFSYFQSGFDPALASSGVGSIALGLAIRDAADEGCRLLDLLHGDEAYKHHWSDHRVPLLSLALYPPGVRGAATRGADAVTDVLRRRIHWRPPGWSLRADVVP